MLDKLIGGLLGGFENMINTDKMSPEERATYKLKEQERKKEENIKRMDLRKDVREKQLELRKLSFSSKDWFQRNWRGVAVLMLISLVGLSALGIVKELPSFVEDLLKLGFTGFMLPMQ